MAESDDRKRAREAILARKAKFVAAALAASGVGACSNGSGTAVSQVCLVTTGTPANTLPTVNVLPTVCLSPPLPPQPTATGGPTMTAPTTAPTVCLTPAPTTCLELDPPETGGASGLADAGAEAGVGDASMGGSGPGDAAQDSAPPIAPTVCLSPPPPPDQLEQEPVKPRKG